MEIDNRLGKKISTLRESQNLKQEELAAKCDLDPKTIQELEEG